MSDNKYRITADSGCDLSLELCESLGVLPYKMPFTMDGEPMVDGMTEESFRQFYEMMRAGRIARTSQINPGEFIDFWRPLAEAGEEVPPRDLLKTPAEIEGIKRSAEVNIGVLDYVAERIAPGITTEQIDQWVHDYTVEHGAIPAPLDYEGFPKSVCTSVNEVVCHGIPSPD